MSIEVMSVLVVLSILIFLISGFPVAFTLIGVSFVFYVILRGPAAMYMIFAATYQTGMTDIFIAIPLFVFMAVVLEFSGLAGAMYKAMYTWMGGLRGGLAIGTLIISTIIDAMTGLAATGTLTMGVLALPEMIKRGYDRRIAMGGIIFGGALGPLIPPSVLMIILGGFTSLSVGKLFMGGIVPGVLGVSLAILYIGVKCFINPSLAPAFVQGEKRISRSEKYSTLIVVLPTIALVFLVLGGIYAGVFTPTEAGGVGALGALICAAVYGQLNWKNVRGGALKTLKVTCMVMWLMIGGKLFASLMMNSGIGAQISASLSGLPISTFGILIIMMGIPFIMGMFMDYAAITMITIPIFMPVVRQIGIDPLWFALLFSINMIIGFLTPPFGMNLFYMRGLAPPDVSLMEIYRSAIPYVVIMLIVLLLCIMFPPVLLWLPNKMG